MSSQHTPRLSPIRARSSGDPSGLPDRTCRLPSCRGRRAHRRARPVRASSPQEDAHPGRRNTARTTGRRRGRTLRSPRYCAARRSAAIVFSSRRRAARPLLERLKAAASAAVTTSGCSAEDFIVAHGAQTCIGHHHGSGQIAPGEPITVDIWPRDATTACYTDMTRTFVAGEVDNELREYHRLCKAALEQALEAIRPGVLASEVYRVAAEVFEEAGQPTLLSKKRGLVLDEGFSTGWGTGGS